MFHLFRLRLPGTGASVWCLLWQQQSSEKFWKYAHVPKPRQKNRSIFPIHPSIPTPNPYPNGGSTDSPSPSLAHLCVLLSLSLKVAWKNERLGSYSGSTVELSPEQGDPPQFTHPDGTQARHNAGNSRDADRQTDTQTDTQTQKDTDRHTHTRPASSVYPPCALHSCRRDWVSHIHLYLILAMYS